MTKLVTIGIPVYKRLNALSNALQSVAAQDYPHIELIVSDNGTNGTKVRDIVEQWYPRPYRFRQNPVTVVISPCYNQLLESATGDSFVALDDDDTISSNFASELVGVFGRYPDVAVAFARQNIVDEAGKLMRGSPDRLPEIVSG
jgi:glycosyltransferase involved in cell wall biosynthesis